MVDRHQPGWTTARRGASASDWTPLSTGYPRCTAVQVFDFSLVSRRHGWTLDSVGFPLIRRCYWRNAEPSTPAYVWARKGTGKQRLGGLDPGWALEASPGVQFGMRVGSPERTTPSISLGIPTRAAAAFRIGVSPRTNGQDPYGSGERSDTGCCRTAPASAKPSTRATATPASTTPSSTARHGTASTPPCRKVRARGLPGPSARPGGDHFPW